MANRRHSDANSNGQGGGQGDNHPSAIWASGAAYEQYIGRWSRLVAREFLAWLAVPPGARWLDLGCGTGALTQAILAVAEPQAVTGVDASAGVVAAVRERTPDPRARFAVADARATGEATGAYDAAVSGLVLNFVPEPERAAAEMARVTRAGGTVAAYVWDYAGRMELLRYFWDAATALDPAAADEGPRFALATVDALHDLFAGAGLGAVETRAIEITMRFRDFADFWAPFLGGEGPAPRYVVALDAVRQAALREALRARLPIAADGTIALGARAWAVRGTH